MFPQNVIGVGWKARRNGYTRVQPGGRTLVSARYSESCILVGPIATRRVSSRNRGSLSLRPAFRQLIHEGTMWLWLGV